jgi:hypothetical protein
MHKIVSICMPVRKLQVLHIACSDHVSPDPAGSVSCFRIFQVASLSKGTDSQRHCYVGHSYRPAAHTGSFYNSVSFRVPILKVPVVKCSSNEHCALQERLNKQINESPY